MENRGGYVRLVTAAEVAAFDRPGTGLVSSVSVGTGDARAPATWIGLNFATEGGGEHRFVMSPDQASELVENILGFLMGLAETELLRDSGYVRPPAPLDGDAT